MKEIALMGFRSVVPVAIAISLWLSPARAEVLSLTVGIDSTCIYGMPV